MTDNAQIEVEEPETKPYKSWVAGLMSAAGTFVLIWLGDDTPKKFTQQELKDAILAAIVMSGLVGVPTYLKRNPVVRRWQR